ncbi:hypothetical protein ACP275_05G146400 [Erythranthe tilingii]
MGSNGCVPIKMSENDAAGCSETTVEIKIKTLDSQTFTLRVDKCVPVPELKEQIASVTGVLSEQQRLICRGKVLKDDQLLSAYHVEDGHTLHLVVRQPIAPSPELSDNPGFFLSTDPTSSTENSPFSRVGPGMVVGTFNISDQGDGAFDINRIVSAVLNSIGVARFGSGGEGIDLNQLPSSGLSTAPGLTGTRNSSRLQSDQAASVAVPVEPPVIPDSLTTLLQYLSHLRQEFIANGGGQGTDEQELEAAANSSEPREILTPQSLAEVMSSARQLLAEQADDCLSQLAGQLGSHSSITDSLERSRIQSKAIRSGALFQNLGALMLELGRAIMTLRMGQTPADALVNAGPSVFVSSTGPNPIMVQPLPFQPGGGSFGSVPVGNVQHGGSGLPAGSAGTGHLPRNIDIRIRTGSLFPRREGTSGMQGQGQVGTTASNNPGGQSQQDDGNTGQVRAIPLRTVVAAVPAVASMIGRASTGLDSSRGGGSLGILYPLMTARIQHASGARPDPNSQQPPISSIPEAGGVNEEGFSGLEQFLTRIFQGEHHDTNTAATATATATTTATATATASAAQNNSDETASSSSSAVSEEGIILSNMLRHIMPMLESNSQLPNSDETQQGDGNRDGASSRRHRRNNNPSSQPSTKRPRRE